MSSYSVKIIRPHNNGPEMKEWSVKTTFSDSDVMRTLLGKDFNEFIQDGDFNNGYIIPGHSAKGRQQPINNSNDLKSCMRRESKLLCG